MASWSELLELLKNQKDPAWLDSKLKILTAYHLMTLIFETTPSFKFIASDRGKMWVKQEQHVEKPA